MATVHRILCIANKWFEADPLMGVLANAEARGSEIKGIEQVIWPRAPQATLKEIVRRPRCVITLGRTVVEVWCIEDLMSPFISHSNTAEKQRALDDILAYGKAPDAVIAFGTGAYPSEDTKNGSVTIGGSVFLYQLSTPPNPNSTWSWKDHMGKIVPSTLPASFFADLARDTGTLDAINKRILRPPVNAVALPQLIIADEALAISSVNILSSAHFDAADREAIERARGAGAKNIASVETTHGVIRAQSEAPFLFITGIPNRVGQFPQEALGNYAQNFAAGHNAGIAACFLIPRLATMLAASD